MCNAYIAGDMNQPLYIVIDITRLIKQRRAGWPSVRGLRRYPHRGDLP